MQSISLAKAHALHCYQFDESHRNRNECALCSMTMLLKMAAQISGLETFRLQASVFGRFLDRIPFKHLRFPAWFPRVGGATHPLAARAGLMAYIRYLRSGGLEFPWTPVLKYRQTRSDLSELAQAGQPTLIYGVGASGIPHVIVPVVLEQQFWKMLDPGHPTQNNPVTWTDAKLLAWWRNYSFIYPQGTLETLSPN